MSILLIISITVSFFFLQCYADCRISLIYKKDLGDLQPLLLRTNKHQLTTDVFYYPNNRTKELLLKQNEQIHVDCPGSEVQVNSSSLKVDNVLIRCKSGKLFEIVGFSSVANIRDITCVKEPAHLCKPSQHKICLDGRYNEFVLGIKLTDGRFITHMSICFDKVSKNTLYSYFNLTPGIGAAQWGYPRPRGFDVGDLYDLYPPIYNLYSRNLQKSTINRLLGLTEESDKYINIADSSDYYLARGHLTAKADFIYGPQQLATFYYVNVAPQFQIFNGNNWKFLEISVRDYAWNSQQHLRIYTGTHGILTLPHEQTKKPVPIHLYQGRDGVKAIPVPKYYWKVVYHPRNMTAVAFIGLNNPYYFNAKLDVFCSDVCHLISWPISWNRTRIEHGYGFCCDVHEFRKTVNNLPDFTVTTLLTDYDITALSTTVSTGKKTTSSCAIYLVVALISFTKLFMPYLT